MKADVSYNDFVGTAAADISDKLSRENAGDTLKSIGRYFKLDEIRFEIVGLSIYGTSDFCTSLICIDKERSSDSKKYIVNMMYDTDGGNEIFDTLFKNLHIVLYEKYDDKYSRLNYEEEVRFSDFHSSDY